MPKYYIISLAHTKKTDAFMKLWGQKSKGYTTNIDDAGEYEELPEGIKDSDLLLVEKWKAVTDLSMRADNKLSIPNCRAVWEELGLKWSATGLRKQVQVT